MLSWVHEPRPRMCHRPSWLQGWGNAKNWTKLRRLSKLDEIYFINTILSSPCPRPVRGGLVYLLASENEKEKEKEKNARDED